MLKKSKLLLNKNLVSPAQVNRNASYYSCGGKLLIPFLLWQNIFTYPAVAVPTIPENTEHKFLSRVEPVSNFISDVSTSASDLLKPVMPENLKDRIYTQQIDAPVPVNAPITPSPNTPQPLQPFETNQQTPLSFYDQVLKDKLSVNVEQYYYYWSDDLGNNGFQTVTPFTTTYSSGNFDFGLRFGYIYSQLNGVITLDGEKVGERKGEVGTWSDTSVSLAYTFKESSWPVRFNLDLNLPTGKATLRGDEKNAIMDGALVQQTRFGEGFNIAPGISVTHALSDKDVFGAGVSYVFRGKFDPNSDVVNDEIKPGDELVGTLQYQHTERNWLFIGGLIYTNSQVTQRDDKDYYRKGERLDANATLVVAPFDGHRIELSGRYYTQGKDDVLNFFTGNLEEESANSNGNALFLGFDWSMALDDQQKHTLHLLGDLLKVEANSYDRINDLFNGNRNKLSVGLGYEYAFSPKSRLFVQAKYFTMNDEANARTQRDISYEGYNLYAIFNYTF